jgi:uncharacterized protein (DUF1684 family)
MAYGAEQWQEWRQRRDRGLRDPLGWLSLVGLHWLGADPARFDTVPGRWSVDGDLITVQASVQDGLFCADEPVVGEHRLKPSGPHLRYGDRDIEIILRGGWYALRVRDPQAATLRGFGGMPMFPFSEQWVVAGTFEPYAGPQTIALGSVIDGLASSEVAVGVIRFTVAGREYAVTAFDGGDGDLDLLFRDATAGATTYAASRSLGIAQPDAEGNVVLDFNRAYNMPCAMTDFATCPLPPRENVLPLAITAGERKLH